MTGGRPKNDGRAIGGVVSRPVFSRKNRLRNNTPNVREAPAIGGVVSRLFSPEKLRESTPPMLPSIPSDCEERAPNLPRNIGVVVARPVFSRTNLAVAGWLVVTG